MKRFLTMVCVLLGLWSFAGAESINEDAAKVMLAAYPGYEIIAGDEWGTAAAAALAKGDERVLCVAEEYNGTWRVVIDNPAALRKGETPSILMDSDNALFWAYTQGDTQYSYACHKANGLWGTVSVMRRAAVGQELSEEEFVWKDGALHRHVWRRDQNDNPLSDSSDGPIPAAWLRSYAYLTNYDVTLFPQPGQEWRGWLDRDALARCAQEIQPGWSFEGGAAETGLELLMRSPEGKLHLVCCTYADGKEQKVVSNELPEGTIYGCENFTTVILLPNGLMAAVEPKADGTWGVHYTWPSTAEGSPVFLGANWVAQDTLNGTQRHIGTHPWGNITAIDWTTLPCSLQEAVDSLNPEGWAVVNNPDPADRLHLRDAGKKGARSLGKYYNGTPVKVLKKGDTWTQVEILGVKGWMMTQYLAFDSAALEVASAMPALHYQEGIVPYAYSAASESAKTKWAVERSEDVEIIGIVGDEWYHVWFTTTDQGAYMKQNDFWAGNG